MALGFTTLSSSKTCNISAVHFENKLHDIFLKFSPLNGDPMFSIGFILSNQRREIPCLASESILDMHRWSENILWCN